MWKAVVLSAFLIATFYSCGSSGVTHGVSLAWVAPVPVPMAPVSGYRVYRATIVGSFALVGTTAQTEYVDTAVSAGQTYRYEVTAVATDGEESAPSNVFTVTVP
jgi:fibronectin type 3 domain-containing protein